MSSNEPLTEAQRRIVARIEQLFLEGEPLNIHAIKRRHPELLAEVMGVEPHWGWRRALAAAGVAYGDFEEELEDKVTCLWCGERHGALGSHITRTHGSTGDAYKEEFPDADLRSETSRRMRATDQLEGHEFALPHWEHVWSREYVLDRIAHRFALGHPLTSAWAEVHDRNLLSQAFLKGGAWEDALLAAGVAPEVTRLIRALAKGSDTWLIEELRLRHAAAVPLADAHVRRVQPALHAEVLGRFGTWADGLARAGIPPGAVIEAPDPVRLARILHEARATAALEGSELAAALRSFQARWETFAMAVFGTWSRLAEAAGVAPDRLHRSFIEHVYKDPASVIREIRRRYEGGIPFHLAAVEAGEDGVRDYALHEAGCRFFGTYREAIEAAAAEEDEPELRDLGIRPLRGRYADANAVVAEIVRRHRAGESLNSKVVIREDRALYDGVKNNFHTWHGGIRAAGFDPAELGLGQEQRRGVAPKYPDGDSVLDEIRRRVTAGIAVNARAVQTGPQQDLPLLLAARRFFQKWDNALRAVGIEPLEVNPARSSV